MARGGRSAALDGLRGYAAVVVVFYHAVLGAKPALIGTVLDPPLAAMHGTGQVAEKVVLSLLNGEISVELFFTLSGLVLFRSLAAGAAGAAALAPSRAALAFAVRRVLRIWPALAVNLIGMVLLFRAVDLALPGLMPWLTPANLGTNLMLRAFPVNGASWTLHAEIAIIPVLLVCFHGARLTHRWFVPFCLLLSVAALKLHAWLLYDPLLAVPTLFFLAGATVERGYLDRLCAGRRGGFVAAGATGALFAVTLLVARARPERLLVQMACLALILAWADTARTGRAIAVLRGPLSQYLGRISYSFYLWNVPVFQILLALIGGRLGTAHPLEVGLAVGALAVPLVLPVATLSERLFERPFVALGRRIGGRQVRAPQGEATQPSLP